MSKNNAENHLNGSGQCPPWHSSVGSGPWRTSSTDMLRVPQQVVHALRYVSELFLMDRQTRAPTKDKLITLCWQNQPAACKSCSWQILGGKGARKLHSLSLASPWHVHRAPNACPDLAFLTPSISHAFVYAEICSNLLVPNEKAPSLAPQRVSFKQSLGLGTSKPSAHRQPQGTAGACLTAANSGMLSSSAAYAHRAQ